MATITVPYKIMAKGYKLGGNVRSGLRATVPCLMAWADAITFVNEVLVSPQATRVGLISWTTPLQFPIAFGGRTPALYVQGFEILPCGLDPNLTPATYLPNSGLGPGEFYSNAIVTLQFESVTYINQLSDDPDSINQLDPANPITACEQSVKLRNKIRTTKGRGYVYKTSGKPVNGDSFAVPETEAILVLKFPRVPYLPWQLVAPFVGKVNGYPMLGVATGALMLDGMDTEVRPQPDGSLGQSVVLEFVVNLPGDPAAGTYGAVGTDWNMQPTGDGTGAWDYVVPKSATSTPVIGYADFRQIFASLEYSG